MKVHYKYPSACFFLCCVITAAQQVKLVPHDKTVDVLVDGKAFTTYHFADDYFYKPVRPFFYPVLASDGTGITTDQQQTDPKHGYQRSIWIGHGDVNGTNHWKFAFDPLAKQVHVKFDAVRDDGFQEELLWTDKAGKPQMDETRTVRFRAYADGVRAIDITLALHARYGDVVLGTHGDRGLLSVRLLESIYGHPTFFSADGGELCEVPPQPKGDTAPGEKRAAPVRTNWCDESGNVDGKIYGAAIFDDPKNPRHAPAWHARANARLATDIFVPDHSRPDGGSAFTIENGKTVIFRYSVLVHEGAGKDAGLADRYKNFVEGK